MTELRALHRRSLEGRHLDRRTNMRPSHQYSREPPPETSHYKYATSYAPPNLVKAHSGSSSSRSCETQEQARSKTKNKQGGRQQEHQNQNDNSIIRGAQILRQQLMSLEDDGDEYNDASFKLGPIHESFSGPYSHQQQQQQHGRGHVSPRHHHHHHDQNVSEDDFSTSSEEWSDPWFASRRTAVSPVAEESEESLSSQVQEQVRITKREPSEENGSTTPYDYDSQTAFTWDTQGWAELKWTGEAHVTPEPMDPDHGVDLLDIDDVCTSPWAEVSEDADVTSEHEKDLLDDLYASKSAELSSDGSEEDANVPSESLDLEHGKDLLDDLYASKSAELSSDASEENANVPSESMNLKHGEDLLDDLYASKSAELSRDESEEDVNVPLEPMDLKHDEDLLDDVFEDLLAAAQTRPQPPPAPEEEDTPETTMGRNRSLRTKTQTYIVQRLEIDEMEDSSPPVALGCSYLPNELFRNTNTPGSQRMAGPTSPSGFPTFTQWDSNADSLDLLQDIKSDEEALREPESQDCHGNSLQQHKSEFRLPTVQVLVQHQAHAQDAVEVQRHTHEHDENSPCQHVVSPYSPLYLNLIRDPAYLHAQQAGTVWQSLVSQHVRFPSKWWNGARGPPLGIGEHRSWNYHGRHRIEANHVLNALVHNRGSAGRILLHLVVRDLMTMQPVQDIAIGCFHPNARGIRATTAFSPELQDCRDIWLAVRRRHDEFSIAESLLKKWRYNNDNADASPLGSRKSAVDNQNMRVVFGELPPMQTMFIMENELYEILSEHKDGPLPPSVILVQQFLRQG